MANNLYNLLSNNSPQGAFGNMQNMMNQFNQFRQSFNGDPQAEVQKLLNSGRVSQAQLNQAVQMANQFRKMFR